MKGNLDNIKNCIKITGFVNSTDDFFDQPKVINPASETLSFIFGDKGKHARAAISTNSLPLGVAVEIDAIFEI
jgi:enamine deaminase RidA (YjgF/YER057c/UK114 family)